MKIDVCINVSKDCGLWELVDPCIARRPGMGYEEQILKIAAQEVFKVYVDLFIVKKLKPCCLLLCLHCL